MAMKMNNWDIVRDFLEVRARLKLGRYERYLVEHIAGRVASLLENRDEAEPAGDDRGGVPEAGGRAVLPSALPSCAPANNPPV